MRIVSGLDNKMRSFHHFARKACEERLQGVSLQALLN